MIFKASHRWSKTVLIDPISKRKIPVVLNAKTFPTVSDTTSKQRIKFFVDSVKSDNASYCLFTSNSVMKTARTAGVSLASQIEAFVLRHSLSEETILAQFGDTYYVANLSAGFVVEEELIPQESFDLIDLMHRDVFAVLGVEGAVDWEMSVLSEELHLTGRSIQKFHQFLPEERAFSHSGYTHPNRKRRFAVVASLLSIGIVALWAHQLNLQREELKRLELQASVIPPKIGSDKSVPQLRMYGDWLQNNLQQYLHFGLRELSFKSTSISMQGETDPKLFKKFYEKHKTNYVLPKKVDLIVGRGTTTSTANRIAWTLSLQMPESITTPEKFGLEVYENYLVATSIHMDRLGVRTVSAAPRTSEHNITTGIVSLNTQFNSPSIFYDIANAWLGVASFAEDVKLTFEETQDRVNQTLEIRMSVKGRGEA